MITTLGSVKLRQHSRTNRLVLRDIQLVEKGGVQNQFRRVGKFARQSKRDTVNGIRIFRRLNKAEGITKQEEGGGEGERRKMRKLVVENIRMIVKRVTNYKKQKGGNK
ncbi:hypothetical protein DRO22_00050 [Candidatus Bathyarchaeota archaeon]|nr:MAG: hypothetical protein DRO22_00050 [Candidatus Bathyarchaeota archaeon]